MSERGEVFERRKRECLLADDLEEAWMVWEVGLEGEEVARESNRVGICDAFKDNLVLKELV